MESLNNIEQQNNEQSALANKLLIEVIQNQKTNSKHLVRVFITTIICYTVLLAVMVIGFFVYESQFEIEETETIRYEQETESDNGNAVGIINNNGDWNYGSEGQTSSDGNEGQNQN